MSHSVNTTLVASPVGRGTGVNFSGGESGPRFRAVKLEWLRELRDRCLEEGVAFFFKQWGGIRPKSGGRELDGRTWDELPARHPAALVTA